MARPDGKRRISLAATVLGIAVSGLAVWNGWQDIDRDRRTTERNAQQEIICTDVNRVIDALDEVLRQNLTPRPGDTTEEAADKEERLNAGRAQLEAARCRAQPLETSGILPLPVSSTTTS